MADVTDDKLSDQKEETATQHEPHATQMTIAANGALHLGICFSPFEVQVATRTKNKTDYQ